MNVKRILILMSLCVAATAGCQSALGEDNPDLSGYWIRAESVYCNGDVDHGYFPVDLPSGWDYPENGDIKITHYDDSFRVLGSGIEGRYVLDDDGFHYGEGSAREYSPVDPLNPYTSVWVGKVAEIVDDGSTILIHEIHESAGHEWRCTHEWIRSVSLNDLHDRLTEIEVQLRERE